MDKLPPNYGDFCTHIRHILHANFPSLSAFSRQQILQNLLQRRPRRGEKHLRAGTEAVELRRQTREATVLHLTPVHGPGKMGKMATRNGPNANHGAGIFNLHKKPKKYDPVL